MTVRKRERGSHSLLGHYCRTDRICHLAAAPILIAAFNSDPQVVHYGVMQARTIALFYFLLAFSHCIAAVLRGSGHASIPMVVMLCVWCLFRVSYITVTVRLIPDIRVIFWAYPLTGASVPSFSCICS